MLKREEKLIRVEKVKESLEAFNIPLLFISYQDDVPVESVMMVLLGKNGLTANVAVLFNKDNNIQSIEGFSYSREGWFAAFGKRVESI